MVIIYAYSYLIMTHIFVDLIICLFYIGLNVDTKESFRSLVLRIGQATGQDIHDSLESALTSEADETAESMQVDH